VRRPRGRRDAQHPTGHPQATSSPLDLDERPPVRPAQDRRTDLFIVGTMYSGSTYLGGLLAANLQAAYVGEMAHLPRFMKDYQLYDDEIGCLLCSAEGVPCPVWSDDTVAAAEEAGPAGSMEVLRQRTGRQLVIDGSKFPEWLRQSTTGRSPAAAPCAVIVAVRSPLRYVLSAAGGTGAPLWVAAQWWRDTYIDTLRTTSRLGLPMLVVRNEDVRTDPQRVVAGVAQLVGREAPQTLRPAESTHSIAGNLWVQKGYSADTDALHYKLGLRDQPEGTPPTETWDNVAAGASITARTRPQNRTDTVTLAQIVLDCPGLTDLAHSFGYEVAREMDTLIREVEGA
jgi:hypothetical protein